MKPVAFFFTQYIDYSKLIELQSWAQGHLQ